MIMKAKHLLALAVFTLTAEGGLRAQEQLTVEALPVPVHRALEQASKGEPIKTINRRVIDGRVVYDIELEREKAINPRFRITEDGIIVAGLFEAPTDPTTRRDPSFDGVVGPQAFDPMIPVEQLPAAVREAIKREAGGREVADVDRETWRGRVVYEIEFKAPGRNPQLHVAEDGTIVRGEESREGRVGAAIRSLLLGTQLEDTPPAVQTTIRRETRDRAIDDIDIERRGRERIYEVKISDARGAFELHVARKTAESCTTRGPGKRRHSRDERSRRRGEW